MEPAEVKRGKEKILGVEKRERALPCLRLYMSGRRWVLSCVSSHPKSPISLTLTWTFKWKFRAVNQQQISHCRFLVCFLSLFLKLSLRSFSFLGKWSGETLWSPPVLLVKKIKSSHRLYSCGISGLWCNPRITFIPINHGRHPLEIEIKITWFRFVIRHSAWMLVVASDRRSYNTQ